MRSLAAALAAAFFFASQSFAGVLPAGTLLMPNQSVYSANGKYRVVMQGDGNFVMYRSDGVVRFASNKAGTYVAMQTDGNLVEYLNGATPVWWTSTQNHPGAYLAVQDDGNLVIYAANGVTPLWWIGVDTSSDDGPSNTGDVVARDLAYPGLGFVGHVGVWTGSSVTEVVSGQSNAVRRVSWESFKTTSTPWATAHPNIPNHLIYYCMATWCDYFTGSNYTTGISARLAIAARANQIYLIGADYTLLGIAVSALPAYPLAPAVRGVYRCDTFVVEVFGATQGWNLNHSVPSGWQSRMTSLLNMAKTPQSVWNALKN